MTTFDFLTVAVPMLYWLGAIRWIHRVSILDRRILALWKDAEQRRDCEAWHHYKRMHENSRFLSWGCILNPIVWFRYWDWQPDRRE